MHIFRPVEYLPADREVGQQSHSPVSLQRPYADFQQQAQVLIIQHLFTVQLAVLFQHPFQQLFGRVEPLHDPLHPALKLFPVRVHSNLLPFRRFPSHAYNEYILLPSVPSLPAFPVSVRTVRCSRTSSAG